MIYIVVNNRFVNMIHLHDHVLYHISRDFLRIRSYIVEIIFDKISIFTII